MFTKSFVDWEAVVKLSDDFNGADLRNVCTEAGRVHFLTVPLNKPKLLAFFSCIFNSKFYLTF